MTDFQFLWQIIYHKYKIYLSVILVIPYLFKHCVLVDTSCNVGFEYFSYDGLNIYFIRLILVLRDFDIFIHTLCMPFCMYCHI